MASEWSNECSITYDATSPSIFFDFPWNGEIFGEKINLQASCGEVCDYINFWWRSDGQNYSNTSPDRRYHYEYDDGLVFNWTLNSLNAERWGGDPSYVMSDGIYYLYVTAEKFVKTGIPVYKSTDLVNWEGPCGADNGLALSAENVWGDKWFFAGAVIEKKGKFYMFPTVDEHLVVATSDSPLGPFKQKIKKPMHNFCEIDSGIFTDDDGKTYIFFVRFDRGNVVFGAELNDDFLTMKEETITECLRPDQPWEFGQNKPLAPINEGAFMLKHKGIYYLTYSGAHYLSKDYAISYATSKNPLGPWKKYKNNPILKANDFVSGTGNGEFIKSPDGSELFCVYHTHKNLKNSLPRALAIDRAYFKTNPEGGPDILVIDGPTIDEQPMPK